MLKYDTARDKVPTKVPASHVVFESQSGTSDGWTVTGQSVRSR